MIAYIKGIVAEIEKDGIVLESQNMGYRIFMPASSLERLGKTGEERMIHTYLHVKEDAMQLYGFLKKEDLAVFRLLLGVNGVGPKGAMGILSCLSGEGLSFAILSDDAAAIAKAPGIGKKTAQKVILELKDKMNLRRHLNRRFPEERNLTGRKWILLSSRRQRRRWKRWDMDGRRHGVLYAGYPAGKA